MSNANDSKGVYYQTLFLSPLESNQGVIKDSYSSLIKIFHPDKNGISEVSQKLTEAYHVLSDPVLRYVYDSLGKEATDLLMSSPKLSLKARQIFDSISLSESNLPLIEAYKAYLNTKLQHKLALSSNAIASTDNTQTSLVYSPLNNTTTITIQHNPTKNITFSFHYAPNSKQKSFFLKCLLSFRSFTSESLYVYPISLHQTARYKKAFVSSLISFRNRQLIFSNNTFGFNIFSFCFAFNRKSGVVFSGANDLFQNYKLSYSLSLLKPECLLNLTYNHKRYTDTTELSFNAQGLTLSNEVYNKSSTLLLNSSLALGVHSCLSNLSFGFKIMNTTLVLPLITYERLDWMSGLLLSIPFLYSKYLREKALKPVYAIYDRISRNNQQAFIEKHRNSLREIAHGTRLSIVIAVVGHVRAIKSFIEHKALDQLSERTPESFGLFDISIALSLQVQRTGVLHIESDIFNIEGVYIPQYANKNEMWYYIHYKINGVDNTFSLRNQTEEVTL